MILRERDRAVAALKSAGFEDDFERQAYDRSWIFRGIKDGVLFDLIWTLPNHLVGIDIGHCNLASNATLRVN